MMHVGQLRIAFRNCKTAPRSVERIATLAMHHLQQMSAPELISRGGWRIVEHIDCGVLRLTGEARSEESIAEAVAHHAWQSVLGHL